MLDDFRTLVGDLVRDVVGRLGNEARDRAIALAVVQYGKDRPRVAIADLVATSAGSPAIVQLPLPAGWIEGQSRSLSIEHPIGHVPPCMLPRHRWSILSTPDGTVIGLPLELAAGDACRLTWSLPHELDDETDTVPPDDREAVAQYAAAVLLDQVAAMVSGDQESTIQADAVAHGTAAPNYGKRAETARQRYHDLLGIDTKRTAPASVIVHPPLASTTGHGRLLYRRPRG